MKNSPSRACAGISPDQPRLHSGARFAALPQAAVAIAFIPSQTSWRSLGTNPFTTKMDNCFRSGSVLIRNHRCSIFYSPFPGSTETFFRCKLFELMRLRHAARDFSYREVTFGVRHSPDGS